MLEIRPHTTRHDVMKTQKQNKYIYLHIVQGNYGYGHGWEDLTATEDYKEARADLKSYRENEPGTPHRLIRRREMNAATA